MKDGALRFQALSRVLPWYFWRSCKESLLTVCANCSFEKEFDGVQDVFELQVRSTCFGHIPGDDGAPFLMRSIMIRPSCRTLIYPYR